MVIKDWVTRILALFFTLLFRSVFPTPFFANMWCSRFIKVFKNEMLLSPKVLTRLWKIFEVSPSLDINLNLFSTNFPSVSLEGLVSPLAPNVIQIHATRFVPGLIVVCVKVTSFSLQIKKSSGLWVAHVAYRNSQLVSRQALSKN